MFASQEQESRPKQDIQERLIAPCVVFGSDGEPIPDISGMLRRLLCFETYILQTIRLREFFALVMALGVDNVIRLLNSGALKLELDPTQIFQTGQTENFPVIRAKPRLPLRHYALSLLKPAFPTVDIVGDLQRLHSQLYGYISAQDLRKLEEAIMKSLLDVPENSGFDAIKGQECDLRSNSPVLIKALAVKLRRDWEINVAESDIKLNLTPLDETDYKAESNLSAFGLDEQHEHTAIEAALLSVGALNRRIEDMRTYNALSGSIDEELPLFAGKFEFLSASLSPGSREREFDRILKLKQMPAIGEFLPDRSFDVERFLEVRDTKECREFRAWLRTTRFESDQEICDRINSIRIRLAPFVHGITGKSLRVVVSGLVGMIPALGIVVGALDTFLAEKLFPISGPVLFLSRQYPALFKTRHE